MHGYKIVRLLGRGGMGAVFEAESEGAGGVRGVDRLAVKILAQKLAQDPVALKRFMHEARLTSRLDHQDLVKIFNYGQLGGGAPYILMEVLTGESLRSRIARDASLPIERCLAISLQLTESLAGAHKSGVVHRDRFRFSMSCLRTRGIPSQRRRPNDADPHCSHLSHLFAAHHYR